MRSATKRTLFVGVTAAFILAVIIFQFNGRRLRAPKRHVAGPRDQRYRNKQGFVPVPRNFGKGPSYRVSQQRGFQDRVRQDRLGDNAPNKPALSPNLPGQFGRRGDSAASTTPTVPSGRGRDWWKDNALKKYPANQAPLGRGVNASLPVKPPPGVGQYNVPRNNSNNSGRRNQQSSVGKTPQLSNTDNNKGQFPNKEGEWKRPGNNFGVNKATGSRAGDKGEVKRQNGSRVYGGRQGMRPTSGSLSPAGREGMRRQNEGRDTWTEKGMKTTRPTTRIQDGYRSQGELRGKPRPEAEQGRRQDGERRFEQKDKSRVWEQRQVGQRGGPGGEAQARGRGSPNWSRNQDSPRAGRQGQFGQQGGATGTGGMAQGRDNNRGLNVGARGNRPGEGDQRRDRDQRVGWQQTKEGQKRTFQGDGQKQAFQREGQKQGFQREGQKQGFQTEGQKQGFQREGQKQGFQREGQKQTFQGKVPKRTFQGEGPKQTSQREGREQTTRMARREPNGTFREKQGVMTNDVIVRRNDEREGRRTSGDNRVILKTDGDKQAAGNIKGQIGSQKTRDSLLFRKTSDTDRRDQPVSDQKRKWPKYTNV